MDDQHARALSRALQAGKNDEIRLLLSKHSAPAHPRRQERAVSRVCDRQQATRLCSARC
jgi:hypothetical protein